VIARKDGAKVRLYSRPGNDLTYRFPLIVESLAQNQTEAVSLLRGISWRPLGPLRSRRSLQTRWACCADRTRWTSW
jgi:ATP-dependent DNA ligase